MCQNFVALIKWGIIYPFIRQYMRIYSSFHKIEKKIFFESFYGQQYSDNPRAVAEKMHELYPEYKLSFFILKESPSFSNLPDYMEPVIKKGKFSLAFYRALATSFCVVTNFCLPESVFKRKDQLFIQTWHGDLAIKKIGYDAHTVFPHARDAQYTDICVAGSDHSQRYYRSAFRYHGKILKIGNPRNDRLIIRNYAEEEKTKKNLGIPTNTKVLLYAPTFRDNLTCLQKVLVDLQQALTVLEEKGDHWVCLIRAHAGSKGLDYTFDGSRFINVTAYPDMSQLMAVSDLLITDYSSCAGDMIRCKKPVVLTMFDKADYEDSCRQLYFDPESVGFICAYTQEELNRILCEKTAEDYARSAEIIMKHFGIYEPGTASEQLCRIIDDFYKNVYLS